MPHGATKTPAFSSHWPITLFPLPWQPRRGAKIPSLTHLITPSLPPPTALAPPHLCCAVSRRSKNIFPHPLQSVACLCPPRPPRPLRETFPTPAEPPSRKTGPSQRRAVSQPSASLRYSSFKIQHSKLNIAASSRSLRSAPSFFIHHPKSNIQN